MLRSIALGALLAIGCEPRTASVPPNQSDAPTSTPTPPGDATPSSPDVTPPPDDPRVLRTEIGWSRPSDPEGPTIVLTGAEYSQGAGAAGMNALMGAIDPMLVCWEAAPRTGRVFVSVRAHGDVDPEAIDVLVSDSAQSSLRECVKRVADEVLPQPGPRQYLLVEFQFAPKRAEVSIEEANPHEIVVVRDAGTCWQWEDHPCPPNKICEPSTWIRTTCGHPTMRNDVRLHIGTPAQTGWTNATDLRLLGPDGRVLWRTELPREAKASLAGKVMGEGTPSVEGPRRDGVQGVVYGNSELVASFASGLYLLDRKTGALKISWQSPPRGASALDFDTGHFIARGTDLYCKSAAAHGAFVDRCHDRWLWFDGYTLAVFGATDHKLLGTKHVGERGATVEHGAGPSVRAKLRVAGVDVEIEGQTDGK